jgi:hypothetical protein
MAHTYFMPRQGICMSLLDLCAHSSFFSTVGGTFAKGERCYLRVLNLPIGSRGYVELPQLCKKAMIKAAHANVRLSRAEPCEHFKPLVPTFFHKCF